MKTFTINDIRAWGPCYNPALYLPEGWSGTALDILDVENCPAKDRLWVVLRGAVIAERELHLLACDYAESVLHRWENSAKRNKHRYAPRKAIAAKRAWLDGNITVDELSAAEAAAWAADEVASSGKAWAAARAAARAAWVVAKAAAWAASSAAILAEEGEAAWAALLLITKKRIGACVAGNCG